MAKTKNQTVLAYSRVSTEEQSVSGLGLDAQRSALQAEAARRGWESVVYVVDEGKSGKTLNRPGISEALRALAAGDASVLVVTKLDRLSRSLLDFATLMEQARREGWSLIVLDVGIDMSTPSGQLMANVMASFSEYERQLIASRTASALQAKKSRGFRLGRPVTLDRAVAQRIVRMRQAGLSTPRIAAALNDERVPTARGGAAWYASTVSAVLRSAELDDVAREAQAS
jgi:DNA invertase Pin-like site-specific DNA recombinase